MGLDQDNDIDLNEDVGHYIHNASNASCKPFNKIIEHFYDDLTNDFK